MGRIAAKSIERILAVQARPKTCWDRLAEEGPSHLKDLLADDPTPPRPATDYQHLLFEESGPDDESEEDDPNEDDDGRPFGDCDRHRSDLLRQRAVGLRRGGLGLAPVREPVLVGAGNAELGGEVLGGRGHRIGPERLVEAWVDEAPADGRVL